MRWLSNKASRTQIQILLWIGFELIQTLTHSLNERPPHVGILEFISPPARSNRWNGIPKDFMSDASRDRQSSQLPPVPRPLGNGWHRQERGDAPQHVYEEHDEVIRKDE